MSASEPNEPSPVVVIAIGGAPWHPAVAGRLPVGALVIAADSGYDHATAAGLQPDLLIGDLDSISDAGVEAARREGVAVEPYPADKDATDTELALERALGLTGAGGDLILVGGGGDDRFDHVLGALGVLSQPRFAECASLSAWVGRAWIAVVHGPGRVELHMPTATTVSLLPLAGDAQGVTTDGLHWPLVDALLPAGTTRGVSNLVSAATSAVALTSGVLAVVVPDAASIPSQECS